MRSSPQRYQGLTAFASALLMLLGLGTLFGQPVTAKSLDNQSPAFAAQRSTFSPRLQITDTTGMTDTSPMTDTAEMTNTMDMTDTAEMTDTMDMTDTAEMTDTTEADMPAADSTGTDNAAATPEASASSMMTDTTMMTGGAGPESALTPGGEQATLAPRERRWYLFKYDYDADAGDPSNVIAELRMEQAGSISFEVWSEQNLRQWQNGEDFTPTGAGTPAFAIGEDSNSSNRDRSLLRWVGGGRATTRYYLIVENDTDAPANYTLTVSGPTVSFPGIASSTGMTTTMAMTDTTAMSTTESMATPMMGGTGPDDAMTPVGQRTSLAPRERRWYSFKYNFNQDENNDDSVDNDASEAIVELRMAQAGALSFEVWSQDDVNRWQNGEDFTPTGAGTPAFAIGEGDDDRDRTLLRWVGSGEATVTYYIIVQNNTDETASYRMTVSGESVSFLGTAAADDTMMNSTATMTATATGAMDTAGAMTETMATDSTTAMTATTDMTTTMGVTDTNMSGGAGPENAMTINGQRETLAAGAQRWYTFEYAYDPETDTDDTPSNAIVELRMAEAGSLSFEVWSGDNVQQWQNNEDFTPTGAGTPAFAIEDNSNADNRDRALLRWVGSSEASVRYYVIVTNNTDAPATYRLSVSGPDVQP